MLKWPICHFLNPQNWFHIKSEWKKKYILLLKVTFPECGNFMIFLSLSLRFYVKSILGIVEVKNLPFFTFRGYEFWLLYIFALIEGWNKSNQQNSELLRRIVNMAFLALLNFPKLISRKIWVIEKLRNFHTVYVILESQAQLWPSSPS